MQQRLVTRPTLGSRAGDRDRSRPTTSRKPPRTRCSRASRNRRSGTFFLLVAHRPGRLLATIRSRLPACCAFPRCADAEIDAILAARDAAPRTKRAPACSDRRRARLAGRGDRVRRAEPRRAARADAQDRQPGRPRVRAARRTLAAAMGARPDRERQLAALELAARGDCRCDGHGAAQRSAFRESSKRMPSWSGLLGQAPTYNFDRGPAGDGNRRVARSCSRPLESRPMAEPYYLTTAIHYPERQAAHRPYL